jgi:hypothetical protein
MEDEGWRLVRALRGGTKAMREAREVYTPRMDMEQRERARYERRLKRSVLYPAYNDRVESLASLPFQKEPTVEGEVGDPLVRLFDNVDRCGTTLSAFAQRIYTDAIDRGLGLFLVDTVTAPDAPLTLTDAIDARPYFARIAPDNLVGFHTETVLGRDVVTELRYREWSWVQNADGHDVLLDRVRVWTPEVVEVWERTTNDRTADRDENAARADLFGYTLKQTIPHGFPDGIPLVTVYTNQVGTLQAKPAMIDLAYLNVAHWESCSVQGDALAYCRAPLRVISGASHEVVEQRPNAGTGATVADTSPDFSVGFVEIAGTSLAAGKAEIDDLRLMMEALGMRPMMAAGGPQTATGEVRADVAEKSKAQSWVENLEWGIYQGFEKAAKWLGQELPEDFDVTLFKDSSLIAGKATDMPVLMQLATTRKLSLATALREIKARGVLVTVDDIDAEVEAIRVEGEQAVQRQMEALAVQIKAERPGPDDELEADDVVAPPARKPVEDEDDEPEDKPKPEPKAEDEDEDNEDDTVVTFNELTLGMERLRRAGNVAGANTVLKKVAALLGVKSMGKVTPPPDPKGGA